MNEIQFHFLKPHFMIVNFIIFIRIIIIIIIISIIIIIIIIIIYHYYNLLKMENEQFKGFK